MYWPRSTSSRARSRVSVRPWPTSTRHLPVERLQQRVVGGDRLGRPPELRADDRSSSSAGARGGGGRRAGAGSSARPGCPRRGCSPAASERCPAARRGRSRRPAPRPSAGRSRPAVRPARAPGSQGPHPQPRVLRGGRGDRRGDRGTSVRQRRSLSSASESRRRASTPGMSSRAAARVERAAVLRGGVGRVGGGVVGVGVAGPPLRLGEEDGGGRQLEVAAGAPHPATAGRGRPAPRPPAGRGRASPRPATPRPTRGTRRGRARRTTRTPRGPAPPTRVPRGARASGPRRRRRSPCRPPATRAGPRPRARADQLQRPLAVALLEAELGLGVQPELDEPRAPDGGGHGLEHEPGGGRLAAGAQDVDLVDLGDAAVTGPAAAAATSARVPAARRRPWK